MANVIFDDILGELRSGDNSSGGSGGSAYIGGDRINIAGGTISFVNSADIVNVTGTSVTLQPDTAYKIYATSQAITLNANPPAAGKWAYDGHLEIFTAGTGYVVTGTNVVLANALEPDAVNNCTVRFHDGIAIIAVEDHIAGYIVVNGSTSGSGSLAYGIATSTNDYVAFDAGLNGQTIPLAGAVAEGEKHVVGNGYTETILTGAIDCGTSKFTVANLGLNNVQVTGGVMTLGDAYIPSGSTVAVSGGGLAMEKVVGAGSASVIDLGETNMVISSGATASAAGCVFSGGYSSRGGAFTCSGSMSLNSVTITDCSADDYGGVAYVATQNASAVFAGCVLSGNNADYGAGIAVTTGATAYLLDSIVSANTGSRGDILVSSASIDIGGSTIGQVQVGSGAIVLHGRNKISAIAQRGGATGTVTISSGAILDLTGNENETPIAPGGGITFESGGATVKVGDSTASSSYMLDNVTLPAGAKLTNTAVVDLGGVATTLTTTVSASGATFTSGGSAAFKLYLGGELHLSGVTMYGNNGNYGDMLLTARNAVCTLTDCDVTSITMFAGSCHMSGSNTLHARLTSTGGSPAAGGYLFITSGAILDLTGNEISRAVYPGSGITFEEGGATVYPSAGSAGAYVLGGITLSALGNTNVISGGMATVTSDAVIKDCAITGATVTIPTAATVSLLGTSVDVPLSGTIIVADGDGDASIELINNAGASVQINGGTYTSIAKDGTTTE